MHPEWSDWLWRRALRTGEAIRLQAHGLTAYRCEPDTDALRADISTALRRRQLPAPQDRTGA